MAVKFVSEEWFELMRKGLGERFSKPGKVTTSFCHKVLECPDGTIRWTLIEFENSLIKNYEMGEGEPPKAAFTAYAAYDTFRRVIVGELDGQQALISGQFKLDGNMIKAMKLIGTYNIIESVMRSIDTEF